MERFDLSESGFKNAQKYSDWVFSYPPDLILVRTDSVAKNPSSTASDLRPNPAKP